MAERITPNKPNGKNLQLEKTNDEYKKAVNAAPVHKISLLTVSEHKLSEIYASRTRLEI